jgi:hypothetical protein
MLHDNFDRDSGALKHWQRSGFPACQPNPLSGISQFSLHRLLTMTGSAVIYVCAFLWASRAFLQDALPSRQICSQVWKYKISQDLCQSVSGPRLVHLSSFDVCVLVHLTPYHDVVLGYDAMQTRRQMQRFGETHCLRLQGWRWTQYESTRRHIPAEHHYHRHLREIRDFKYHDSISWRRFET